MRKIATVFSVLTMLILAACSTTPAATKKPAPAVTPATTQQPSPAPESGITGNVLIGPTCPVQREGDTSCDDQPFQATITVLDQSGSELTRFETDAQGQFQITLAPGTYTLRPEKPDPNVPLPFAGEVSVTVTAGLFTLVTINYDTGIR